MLDFPFDTETHSAADDRTRVLKLRERLGNRSAVAWLPVFFTADVLDKLSRLIRVDYLLQDRNHLEKNTLNIGAEDRQRARDLLRNLQGSLRSELREALKNAYGLVARPKEEIVQDWHDHLASLDATVNPRLDAGRPFADALRSLVDQLYVATYPDHPDFDPQRKGQPSRPGGGQVLAVVRRAIDEAARRPTSPSPALQRLAHRCSRRGARRAVALADWEKFERRAARLPGDDVPVRAVREWLADLGLETVSRTWSSRPTPS